MVSRVFISHSRQDTELTLNIVKALENIGSTAVAMEYVQRDSSDVPDWDRIRSEVAAADHPMLFKTDNAIKTDYTENWVMFEVGLAAALKKRLLVFERRGPQITFPIPYVTGYMLFDPQKVADVLQVQAIARVIRKELTATKTRKLEKRGKKEEFSGLALLALFVPEILVALIVLGTLVGLASAVVGPVPVTCGRCRSRYRYYAGVLDPFKCPVCLCDVNPAADLDEETVHLIQGFKAYLESGEAGTGEHE